jgi:hypothetical protein
VVYNGRKRVYVKTGDDADTNIEIAAPVTSALRVLRFHSRIFKDSDLLRCAVSRDTNLPKRL